MNCLDGDMAEPPGLRHEFRSMRPSGLGDEAESLPQSHGVLGKVRASTAALIPEPGGGAGRKVELGVDLNLDHHVS